MSLDTRNYNAVAQTLEHHGECMRELSERIEILAKQLIALKQELEQQRGLIVRSLQQKYGHGSTSVED